MAFDRVVYDTASTSVACCKYKNGRKRICFRKVPDQISFKLATVVIEVPKFVSSSVPTNVELYLEIGHDYLQVLFYSLLVFTSIHSKHPYKTVDKMQV
jgi:hypothetical protein